MAYCAVMLKDKMRQEGKVGNVSKQNLNQNEADHRNRKLP